MAADLHYPNKPFASPSHHCVNFVRVSLFFSVQELEDILGRPASNVHDLAQAAVARSRELSGGISSISKSDSETKTPCGSESFDIVSDIPLTMEEEGKIWTAHLIFMKGKVRSLSENTLNVFN